MRDGHILTPYFSTYLLPTVLDMPTEIMPVILELADPNGPYGARGVAEMPLVPFAPAVAAAIHDATGVWLTQQPMTPERVLAALTPTIALQSTEGERPSMTTLTITVGPYTYTARMEEADAPATCAAFAKLLPYTQKIIHARWSGEACWIPLGDFTLDVGYENHTSHPAPGEILFYPGGFSETEILFPYGACASPARSASSPATTSSP